MIRVFINYRQADTEAKQAVEHIHAHLCDALYDPDFVTYDGVLKDVPINQYPDRVADSDVLLVLIGTGWMTQLEHKQTMPNQTDWVLEEIHTGLTTDGVLVIPVLINDASFPPVSMLPDKIKSLGYRRAETIRNQINYFSADMRALVQRIKRRHERFGGAARVYDNLPEEILQRMVEKSRSSVRFMGIWTSQLGASLQRSMMEAVEKGASIEVLLLNPDSPAAIQRSRDLGNEDEYTSDHIRGNIMDLKRLMRKLKDKNVDASRIRLKLYDATPSRVVYIADETTLIGSHPVGELSRDAPYILAFGENSGLYKSMKHHFENLWRSDTFTTEVPLNGG